MKLDFSKYQFRASQCHKLLTGAIGLTEAQTDERNKLFIRKTESANGMQKPLTEIMKKRLAELEQIDKEKCLPQTMKTELRKIHRAEMYNRNFSFTNKYVQKGIIQEDEGITAYMMFRNAKGIRTMFRKNEARLYNDWFTGIPDLGEESVAITSWKEGWDNKCSWDLSTFPFESDPLDPQYATQNNVYMDLTGTKKWTTVHTLVNATERLVNNEKLKWFYAFEAPDAGTDDYEGYIKKCKEVERTMIFDYNRFVLKNPHHLLENTKEEWFETVNPATGLKGFDIPLENRVVEHVVVRDDDLLDNLKNRIVIARKFLNEL